MHTELLDYLACPFDQCSRLEVERVRGDRFGGIGEGVIRCRACARKYPIRESIPMFAEEDPPVAKHGEANRWQVQEKKVRDSEAEVYDSCMGGSVLAAERGCLSNLLNLKGSHRMLDLGCGTGVMTRDFANVAATTIGVDFSYESLRVFQRHLDSDSSRWIHLVQADILHLPFRAQVFHRVLSTSVLQHVPGLMENSTLITETARVLREEGVFVLSVYNHSTPRVLVARLLPMITNGTGYEREGFHLGKVYFRRFAWWEVNELLDEAFEVEYIGGMQIVPKGVLTRGGKPAFLLERVLQRTELSRILGYYVVAKGRKRTQLCQETTEEDSRIVLSGNG